MVLRMLLLMSMLMTLALTLMFLLDTSNVVAYASVANVDEKMPNVARHLAGAYDVLMLPPLLPMLMLLRQLLLANAYDDVMLKCV